MVSEDLKALQTRVNKLKFKAVQKGGDLHDLVEDRLLHDFEDLIPFAKEAYEACQAWSILNNELIEKQNS